MLRTPAAAEVAAEFGVPAGTTAEVVLPDGETKTFTGGRHTVSSGEPLS
jgi:hypothetical protein